MVGIKWIKGYENCEFQIQEAFWGKYTKKVNSKKGKISTENPMLWTQGWESEKKNVGY